MRHDSTGISCAHTMPEVRPSLGRLRALGFLLTTCGACAVSQAQWTGQNLSMQRNTRGELTLVPARALVVKGNRQFGESYRPNIPIPFPAIWSGTGESVVRLGFGLDSSRIIDVDKSQPGVNSAMIGTLTVNDIVQPRAHFYKSPLTPYISLRVPGVPSDVNNVYGIDRGQQVGTSQFGGRVYASMWLGSTASRVDLTPSNATRAGALDVSGGMQVGVATIDGVPRAGYWTGTAASWVALDAVSPMGSEARIVDDGAIAGTIYGAHPLEVLWTRIHATPRVLTPKDPVLRMPLLARVLRMDKDYQVGAVQTRATQTEPAAFTAALWNSTSSSWENLQPAIDEVMRQTVPAWTSQVQTSRNPELSMLTAWRSIATDVSIEGDTLHVVGYANYQNLPYAFLLTRPLSARGCDSLNFNNDTVEYDTVDLRDFVSALNGNPCSTGTCNDTDFNNDGAVGDADDLRAFLSRFAGEGCL